MALKLKSKVFIAHLVAYKSNQKLGNIEGSYSFDRLDRIGYLAPRYLDSFRSSSYAIWSYQTPIAWWLSDSAEWIQPDEYYSNATSDHQSVVAFTISAPSPISFWRDLHSQYTTGQRYSQLHRDLNPVRPQNIPESQEVLESIQKHRAVTEHDTNCPGDGSGYIPGESYCLACQLIQNSTR